MSERRYLRLKIGSPTWEPVEVAPGSPIEIYLAEMPPFPDAFAERYNGERYAWVPAGSDWP
jgi:hypothetical protein